MIQVLMVEQAMKYLLTNYLFMEESQKLELYVLVV